jgi:hypothetical protein
MPSPKSRDPARRTSWLPRILLALFALLVLAEVLTRVVGPPVAGRLGVDMRPTSALLADQGERIRALRADDTSHLMLDSMLGWRFRPGYASARDRMNAAGLRSDREYDVERPAGVRRIAVFGDAYAYGAEVPNEEAWPALLEAAAPGLEVLNHGVGGFGTDQAFLQYLRDGSRYGPEVVLIGFSPVGLRRSVNVWPRFISADEAPIAKPRFRLDGASGPMLVPNPLATDADWERLLAEPRDGVRALGEHDAWYEPLRYANPLYDLSALVRFKVGLGTKAWRRCCWAERPMQGGAFREGTEAFAVQRAVLLTFADSVRARGAQPVIVLFPDHDSVEGARQGGQAVYAPLRESLREGVRAASGAPAGTPVLDLLDAFTDDATTATGTWFAPGGHYSREGNARIAAWLGPQLAAVTEPGR